MARVKSKKYDGVYLNHLKNGDITYSITYKDEFNKKVFFKIGKKSDGITEVTANLKRSEAINQINLGIDPLAHKKKKNIITLEQLAKVYFDDNRCMTCNNCKVFSKLSDADKMNVTLTDKDLNCDLRKRKHLRNKYNLHLAPPFGKANLQTLKKDDIQKFRQVLLGQGKAPNTINGIIQLIGTIINYSIKNKELQILNPCVGVSKLATDSDRKRYLDTVEVHTLFDALTDDLRTLLFVKLALTTGGRLDTILNIRKVDLNFTQNTITLIDFKNDGETYMGFMNDELKEELKTLSKDMKPTDYIIGKRSKALSINALSNVLRPILNKLFNVGLDKDDRKNRAVIHTLRHTFASHLAINSTPIFTIQKLMNHKDIKMTMRYAKLAPDSGREMVKQLYR